MSDCGCKIVASFSDVSLEIMVALEIEYCPKHAAVDELLTELKEARRGYLNLVDMRVLPHSKWDQEATRLANKMGEVIDKAEKND